jgi:hypothetical protein
MSLSLKRQALVDAFETRMKTIKKSGDYYSDIGLNVFVWKRSSVDETEQPGLNIKDDPEVSQLDSTKNYSDRLDRDLTVTVTVFAQDDDKMVRKMMADVEKAVGTDPTFGGLAIDAAPTGNRLLMNQDEKVEGAATLDFTIMYRRGRFDEF